MFWFTLHQTLRVYAISLYPSQSKMPILPQFLLLKKNLLNKYALIM